jgi:hypothetical protein
MMLNDPIVNYCEVRGRVSRALKEPDIVDTLVGVQLCK